MEEQLKQVNYAELQKAAGLIGVDAVGVKKPNLIVTFLQTLIDLPTEDEAKLTDEVHQGVQAILSAFGKDTMEDTIEVLTNAGKAPSTQPDKKVKDKKAKKDKPAKAAKPAKEPKPAKAAKPKKDAATIKITELVVSNPKASADDIVAMLEKGGYKAKRNTVTTVYRFVHLTIDNLKKLDMYKE